VTNEKETRVPTERNEIVEMTGIQEITTIILAIAKKPIETQFLQIENGVSIHQRIERKSQKKVVQKSWILAVCILLILRIA
jgi:hypothetical protein